MNRKYLLIAALFAVTLHIGCKKQVLPVAEEKTEEEKTEEEEEETPPIVEYSFTKRGLWASINGTSNATYHKQYDNRILVSWRMFPEDDDQTAFDLYCSRGGGAEIKLNRAPIKNATNFQDTEADLSVQNVYRLCYTGDTETLDTYTMTADRALAGLPYVPIPLMSTADIHPTYTYLANDCSIGDLDGDGEYEIIVKRLVSIDGTDRGDEEDPDNPIGGVTHSMLLEAYKLNGTFLWRIAMGPNHLTGNQGSFAVYDFDGDGRAEIAIRTAEGTIFGDGTEIGDTDGDGKTDYRVAGANYIHGGPEFLSVVDGLTGKELARTDYIALGTSEDWGDNYYKRSSSYRLGLGKFSSERTSILICRGVYAKSVLEAWDYKNGELTKRWRFDTSDGVHGAYAGQGNHSLSVGDVDGDGFDEVVYGACTIDHDGSGLNNSGFGHGDMLHLGKFDPNRSGLQIWSCFEGGSVGAAFRDAASGNVIWKYDNSGDVGRALIADIDPDNPGAEMWWYQGNAHSVNGVDLGYAPKNCNAAIWFSGSLNRQLLDGTTIDGYGPVHGGRVFTIYRYNVSSINSTKKNVCWYGDFHGDWREEILMVANDNSELRLFTTWYPTEYKFPYLMSDHVYEMSAINQNIGYNQPTQLGYYLGSDLIQP